MQIRTVMFAMLVLASFVPAQAAQTKDAIAKVIEMISDLEAKTIAEGEAAQKTYEEFSEFCEERSKELSYEIKTATGEVEDLKATISKATADMQTFTTKVEELGSAISTADADLKAATTIREKEAADFSAEEAELIETINTVTRAATIIEKEMAKGASMLQLKNAQSLTQALTIMVQAEAISAADSAKLTALVQSSSANDNSDSDEELGAPAAATYENKSGGIVELLHGLIEKAETQLDEARKAEEKSLNDYSSLKQTLENTMKYGAGDMDASKKSLAEAEETKGTAEGDLAVTSKDLAEDSSILADVHRDCMDKANTFESETTARGNELKALATAKKVIKEATSLAQTQSYSFLQVSAADSPSMLAVHMVRRLAEQHQSKQLALLATHMGAAMRYGVHAGEDPFAKIKGLITDMIEKLSGEAEADAAKQGYCVKNMAETKASKEDKEAEIEKLSTKIDQMTTESEKLKEEVAVLQKELASLAETQATMNEIRTEEKEEYQSVKAELEKGLTGIKLALKTLRDYYAQGDSTASADAGGGIISLLEVVEADFTQDLDGVIVTEKAAASTYEKETKENDMAKLTKDQDVKYKSKEAKSLDEGVAELKSDVSGVQTELDAVMDFWNKLQSECVAKPEPYEEKKKRREEEIAGLKEALTVLENEAALIQKSSLHSTLRGARVHRA